MPFHGFIGTEFSCKKIARPPLNTSAPGRKIHDRALRLSPRHVIRGSWKKSVGFLHAVVSLRCPLLIVKMRLAKANSRDTAFSSYRRALDVKANVLHRLLMRLELGINSLRGQPNETKTRFTTRKTFMCHANFRTKGPPGAA